MTGFLNQVGNKGGISVSFKLGKTNFMFITCHLAAHQDKIEQRNAHYNKIISEIEYMGFKPGKKNAIFEKFDYIFFFGDLNYRINGNRKVVDKILETKLYEVLLANDQLQIEKKKGNIFQRFEEAPIRFLPTYKFALNSDKYDNSKKLRIPAYTDRVLWYAKNPKVIQQLEYNCCSDVRVSDHRPVFSRFLVTVNLPKIRPKKAETTSQFCSVM